MSKKILIVACVVMMTMVFSGCNLPGKDKGQEIVKEGVNTEQDRTSEKDEKNDSKDGNYYETLTNLMARGKSMRCTYTQDVEGGGTATGVVHMADKNALTEITIKEAIGPFRKMYALVSDEWMYSWTDASSKGYKMTVEAGEMSEKNKETVSNMSKEIDFKCKSWKKDKSKFKVPSNIEFEDMSEVMGNLGDIDIAEETKNAKAQSKEFLCNHCKNAPTPELVAECLGDVVCD